MSTSSIMDGSIGFQELRSTRPQQQSESERLKLLLDLTNAVVSNLECRDLLRTVSASIRQVMRCDTVGVWLQDAKRIHLRQLALDFPGSRGFVREDLLHPVEGSLIGEGFKTGKPLIVGVMSEQIAPTESAEARAEALESRCAVPLITLAPALAVLPPGSRSRNRTDA